MHWRYVSTKRLDSTTGAEQWEIRELYTEEDGRFSYTENPISPFGESREELERDVTRMAEDLQLDYLDLTGKDPELKPHAGN